MIHVKRSLLRIPKETRVFASKDNTCMHRILNIKNVTFILESISVIKPNRYRANYLITQSTKIFDSI